MEDLNWFVLAITLLFIIITTLQLHQHISKKYNKNKKNRPPSPPSLPIIGHLHMLKPPVHKTLHEISTKHGGVQMLKLGTRNMLLISSPLAVEECLVKNDAIFANRPNTLAGRIFHYNNTSMAFSPYNDHFRTLKRLMTQEVFSSTHILRFSAIRQDEVRLLLEDLWQGTGDKLLKVDLNKCFNDLALNIMTRMTAGKRYYGKGVDSKEGEQFAKLLNEGSVLSGAGNPGDYIPLFKWLFRGHEKAMVAWMNKTDCFYQRLLDERNAMNTDDMGTTTTTTTTKAIIDVLISAQEQNPNFFTNDVIKGMIMVLVLAGAHTSAATMEWAMSLLLNHPKALHKAQEEIDGVIGRDRLVNEDDISKLPYLQNVINETLRLYPPTPLLLPHESSEDCTICGYDIPKGTMLMVSLWTLHRDPKYWSEPEKFVPERFEGKEGETVYKLIPFGLGRRACPGYAMSKRAVGLVLGSLLQCFDWERPGPELIDMDQSSGITMPKNVPLKALCKVRPSVYEMLSIEKQM
ncbi:cytochrome P450 81Q32-like [Silene latifolia]|uniref:cytochrome P450 81Q32-like n=1 Tax=Silene latifolia TaxID=37657 RepID=UPI003D77B48C